MKKTLLTIFAGVLMAGSASAQCTFDQQYANASGNFFPDSATFYDNNIGMIGQPYEAFINVKTIVDTAVQADLGTGPITVDAKIDAFKVLEVVGAPAGFNFTGGGDTYETPDPTNFGDAPDSTWWNVYGTAGNVNTLSPTQGCLQITADAAAVSNAAQGPGITDYEVTVIVDARIVDAGNFNFIIAPGSWLSDLEASGLPVAPLPVEGYVLRVDGTQSISELLNPNVFEVHQSYPNPAEDFARITFTNPGIEEVEFKVFNMLGALVHSETILSERGVNDIELNTTQMSSGMYIYTVSKGEQVFTKKLTVK